MIGCGLAHDDTWFILVQATCPTSSFSRSVNLFLSPGARSLLWGYKRVRNGKGVLEAWSDSEPSGREWRMLKRELSIGAYAVCVWAYQLLRAYRLCSYQALELLCCCLWVLESSILLVGESASPFIVEGDGLTSQRERESAYGRCLVLLPMPSGMGWSLWPPYCSCYVVSGRWKVLMARGGE